MAHIHGAAAAAKTTAAEQGMAGMAMAAPTSFHNVAAGAVATGTAAVASTSAGRSLAGKILKHPLVIFGLGLAVGYAIHKYRKEIIESATRATELGKDFVLQQRENLEDLVAEARESEG
jgi:hypothetical protein